ncbi:MAG: hypothetical protein IPG80_18950 [Anaerolineales bacterium]|uniref:hypothetical protein n=1 Tax=Candidatus Villigracilis vicinus TaxID=3140679 RepID=UPI00313724B4|nr:hypothetical protein [Anaerolineales bacterium]
MIVERKVSNEMSNEMESRVRADFSRARFKSFINQVFSVLSGQRNNLLSYDDVKEKLRIGGPIYRGMKTVRVDQIAGSLNRYHEFDRAFLPKEDQLATRWTKVDRAFYEDIHLPPVVLYKVGDVFFVVDGHHRVSVAREQGQEYIEAEVRECATRVNITPDIKPEDLEILGAKVDFLERSGLDKLKPEANIKLNIPDGFNRMLEHIAVHRYFMGLDFKRDISEQEAVVHWYDTVYMPIVNIVRESGLLDEFPKKTEGDLYLWTLDHQHYLYQEGQPLQPPETAAKQFIEENE